MGPRVTAKAVLPIVAQGALKQGEACVKIDKRKEWIEQIIAEAKLGEEVLPADADIRTRDRGFSQVTT